MLNCTSKKQAEKAIRKALREGIDEGEIVLNDKLNMDTQITIFINALLDKHQLISHWFFQPVPAGWALQLLDSKITMGVMLEMMLVHKAVALSIHDSFIVQTDYTEVLKDVMRNVYKRVLGYIPQVELTSTKLKLKMDEGSSSSHSLYEQRAKQYLKNKGEVPEYPLDPPYIFPAV